MEYDGKYTLVPPQNNKKNAVVAGGVVAIIPKAGAGGKASKKRQFFCERPAPPTKALHLSTHSPYSRWNRQSKMCPVFRYAHHTPKTTATC